MKTYDIVLKLLETNPETRNNDRLLIWSVWKSQGLVNINNNTIEFFDFNNRAISPESIRRMRQKFQETRYELKPTSARVSTLRRKKATMRGTFIYRENVEQGRFI
jgi:hypothetical protein